MFVFVPKKIGCSGDECETANKGHQSTEASPDWAVLVRRPRNWESRDRSDPVLEGGSCGADS